MKLIDCTYLNSPGGKKILSILLENINKKESNKILFLVDSRVDKKILKGYNFKIINNSEIERKRFYRSVKNDLVKCFCMANVPPPIKLKCKVYIYFHNDLILNPGKSKSLHKTIIFWLKKIYIKFINHKDYIWMVQTNMMKINLSKSLQIKNNSILIFPIYKKYQKRDLPKKVKNSFIYVCSSENHKNLKNLILGFSKIINPDNHKITLHLTIEDPRYFKSLKGLIKNDSNVFIKNHGYIEESLLHKLYSNSEFLIYPSLIESFGLPLIECLDFNCKIIASDLPYVNEVVEPSLTFDPYSVKTISESIDAAIKNCNYKPSKILINNKIDKFIELIYS